jgi:hypothetical protein
MKRTARFGFLALISIPIVACSGTVGDDNGGGSFSITVPGEPTQMISELTEEEELAVCEEFRETTIAPADDDFCNSVGAMAGVMMTANENIEGDFKELCEAAVENCEGKSEEEIQEMTALPECTDPTYFGGFEGCEVTVADFQSCVNEVMAQAESFNNSMKDLSCDSDPSSIPNIMEIAQPACMAEINQLCPGAFPGGGS